MRVFLLPIQDTVCKDDWYVSGVRGTGSSLLCQGMSRYLRVSDRLVGERADGLREVGMGPDRGC
jgi:hypothetical protein